MRSNKDKIEVLLFAVLCVIPVIGLVLHACTSRNHMTSNLLGAVFLTRLQVHLLLFEPLILRQDGEAFQNMRIGDEFLCGQLRSVSMA